MTKNGRTRDPCATISTHILRMEDDAQKRKAHEEAEAFQSTSCAWRTTKMKKIKFYTLLISIHVLRMEDDLNVTKIIRGRKYFNPRPPHGGRHPRIAVSPLIK